MATCVPILRLGFSVSFFLILLISPVYGQEGAPWGLSQMQFGAQYSRFQQKTDYNSGAFRYYNHRSNTGYGLNGRIQLSFLDLLLFGDGNPLNKLKFRIVDIIAFEGGAGYLKDEVDLSVPEAVFTASHNTLWHNVGIEAGLAFMVRVIPTVDLGVKYGYLSHANATFGKTSYIPQANGDIETFGRSAPAYGNSNNWGFLGRYRRIYLEINLLRDQLDKDLRLLNIVDLKYRFAEHTTWASYVGVQFGSGVVNSFDISNGEIDNVSRRWVQLSIGKMTNF